MLTKLRHIPHKIELSNYTHMFFQYPETHLSIEPLKIRFNWSSLCGDGQNTKDITDVRIFWVRRSGCSDQFICTLTNPLLGPVISRLSTPKLEDSQEITYSFFCSATEHFIKKNVRGGNTN